MFKKFFVVFLVFITLFSFTACGGQGEKGEKGDTGSQGPQGVQGPQGPAGDSGLSDTLKIYQLGETAKVYSNGMLMFTIKYASKNTSKITFEIRNNNIPHTKLNEILLIRAYNSNNPSESAGISIQPSDYLSITSVDPVFIEPNTSFLDRYDRMYFFSASTGLIFAVFKL